MLYTRSPRRYLAPCICLLLLAFFLVACSNGDSAPAPSAQQLIKNAQAAIQKLTAYHFNLKTENLGTNSALPLQSADGDLLVPDKLQANANVLLSGAVIQTQIIAIGDVEYLNILGTWQKTTGLLSPTALSDPQTGVAALVGHIQNPSQPKDSTSNNQPCWSTSGKLDPTYLSGLTGGGAPAGTMDDVTTCIGKSDNLPYLIVIKGISAQGDTAQTTRTLVLSKFNEKITISAPATASFALPLA